MNRIKISEFLSLSPGKPVLDVRSPSEYAHAHIPGAINLPLFSDQERKEVGTAYKQVSRESAIKIGLDFFGPKMKSMVEAVEKIMEKDRGGEKDVFLYCWRGGMRSAAVAWLLDLYGFRVHLLAGGYKSFRNHVLKTFELPFNFRILGGYTGSGKTAVLRQLEKKGEIIVDLEGLASHKGSAFGNIEMPAQPSQEMFDNLLAMELLRKAPDPGLTMIWMEDESQRIGNINLPLSFWNTMRKSPVFFIEIDFEKRLEYLCEEYGNLNREKLSHATSRIHKRLGPNNTKKVLEYIEQGNIREAFRILLHYYDKHYLKGLHNRNDLEKLLTILPCNEVSPENSRLLETIYLPI